jgi:hypothetical protein
MGADDNHETSEVAHAALATAVLADDVGTWDADLEIKPSPTAPVQYQKGYRTCAMVGDRWLATDVRMYSGFAGHGLYGWDEHAQCYVGVWADTVSSTLAHAKGRYDPRARTMTYDVEVQHRGRTIRYREVTEAIDADTRVYTHRVPLPSGGEHEMMRITYRRRRA